MLGSNLMKINFTVFLIRKLFTLFSYLDIWNLRAMYWEACIKLEYNVLFEIGAI